MWNFNKSHKRERNFDCHLKQLDIDRKPQIKLQGTDLPQQHVCHEEALDDQQLCNLERKSSIDQEIPDPPQIKLEKEELCISQEVQQLVVKEEMNTSLLTPIFEESDQKLPQQYVLKAQEEVLTDQQLFNQERNSSVEQEESVPPQIKKEQVEPCTSLEVEQVVVKEETDAFMRTPTFEENCHREKNHSEDQTLYLSLEETRKAARKESLVNMPIISSVVGAPNSDLLLLSDNSCVVESQNQNGDTYGKYFNFKGKLHFKRNAGKGRYVCQTCGKGFRRNVQLTVHMRIHSDEKPYVCETCGKGSKSKYDLAVHMRIHSDEKPYVCQTCEKAFKSKRHLTVHMSIHSDERPYVCQTCEKGFKSKRDLTVHMRVHSDEKSSVCNKCGKCFTCNSYLTAHMRIHSDEKQYVCKTCGKGFRWNNQLTIHMRIHTGEKPYVCETCGKDFRSNSELTLHMRIHSDEMPYICNLCGKGFRSNSQLTVHMRIHSGEKPYVCKSCGKGFRAKPKLTVHMRIHSEEKPYICKTCGKDFRNNGQLTAHMRIHSDEKPYICKTCGKCFRRSDNLTRHTRDTHYNEKVALPCLLINNTVLYLI